MAGALTACDDLFGAPVRDDYDICLGAAPEAVQVLAVAISAPARVPDDLLCLRSAAGEISAVEDILLFFSAVVVAAGNSYAFLPSSLTKPFPILLSFMTFPLM